MDESAPLRITHDVAQGLQRKIEGWFFSPAVETFVIKNGY
jgi:hypothetical protein